MVVVVAMAIVSVTVVVVVVCESVGGPRRQPGSRQGANNYQLLSG